MSADTTPGLAPCPFCGAGAKVFQETSVLWIVECSDCGAMTHVEAGRSYAIEAWNRRAPAPAPPSDWDLRGMLAARLSCWHRLTGSESDELVALARSWGAPAASGEPVAWLIQLSPATLGGQELTTLRDRAKLARHLGYSVTNLYAKPAQS